MAGKATLTLVGRLARDPEMRFTGDGKAVCSFSIPVQERKDGETTWFKCTAWEKAAEVINQYAAKGTWLQVTGTVKVETWEDKNSGEARHQLAVTVREFTFCGGASAGDGNSEEQPRQTAPAQQANNRAPAQQRQQTPARRNAPQSIESDEDLPF